MGGSNLQKVIEKKEARYILLYFVAILALTISTPDNLLDEHVYLHQFVEYMSIIFGCIGYFLKYSDYPQIFALLYSVLIISTPFIAVPFYKNRLNDDKIRDKMTEKGPDLIMWGAVSITALGVVVILSLFPGESPYNNISESIQGLAYHSKFGFAVYSSGSLGVVISGLSWVAACVKIRSSI